MVATGKGKQAGKFLLSQAPASAEGNQVFHRIASGPMMGVISEEVDDQGDKTERGAPAVIFPVPRGCLVCPKSLGYILLHELEVEPALSQMVAEGLSTRCFAWPARLPTSTAARPLGRRT